MFDEFFNDDDWLVPAIPRMEMMKPAMDLYETDTDVIAEVNVPDFDPKDIKVEVDDNTLRVHGTMEKKEEEKRKGYLHREINKGSFERAIHLPTAVDADAVKADYHKGLLKITMPKVKPTHEKKVKVEVTER